MKIVDGRLHKAKITDSRQLVNGKAAAAAVTAATADIMKTLAGVQASEAKRSQDNTCVVTDENSDQCHCLRSSKRKSPFTSPQ